MTQPSAVIDMRSSFAARSETGDFLNAEKIEDASASASPVADTGR